MLKGVSNRRQKYQSWGWENKRAGGGEGRKDERKALGLGEGQRGAVALGCVHSVEEGTGRTCGPLDPWTPAPLPTVGPYGVRPAPGCPVTSVGL